MSYHSNPPSSPTVRGVANALDQLHGATDLVFTTPHGSNLFVLAELRQADSSDLAFGVLRELTQADLGRPVAQTTDKLSDVDIDVAPLGARPATVEQLMSRANDLSNELEAAIGERDGARFAFDNLQRDAANQREADTRRIVELEHENRVLVALLRREILSGGQS